MALLLEEGSDIWPSWIDPLALGGRSKPFAEAKVDFAGVRPVCYHGAPHRRGLLGVDREADVRPKLIHALLRALGAGRTTRFRTAATLRAILLVVPFPLMVLAAGRPVSAQPQTPQSDFTTHLRSRQSEPAPALEQRLRLSATPHIHSLVQVGPHRPDHRASLAAHVIELEAYIPNNVWLASAPGEDRIGSVRARLEHLESSIESPFAVG